MSCAGGSIAVESSLREGASVASVVPATWADGAGRVIKGADEVVKVGRDRVDCLVTISYLTV